MNKPGSIFGSYGSQKAIIEVDEDTTIDILEEDEGEILVEVEDRVHFVDDYERLKNKPTLNGVEIVGNKTSEDFGIPAVDPLGPARPDELGGVKAEILENVNANLIDAQVNTDNDHLYVAAVAYGKEQDLTDEEKETGRDNIEAICTRDKIYDTEIDGLFEEE